MKQNKIILNEIYYIKQSPKIIHWNLSGKFIPIKIIKQNKRNRYFNNKNEWVYANELTDIPCKFKICPCH